MHEKNFVGRKFWLLLAVGIPLLAFYAGYNLRKILDEELSMSKKRNAKMRRDVKYVEDTTELADMVSASSIRDYLRYFTSVPHMGGTKESHDQAKYLAEQLRKFGFDKVELKKYNALLSFPRAPGNISLFGEDGAVLFNSTILEKPLHESEGDPREVYPFNAYTASGQAEGELVYVNYGTNLNFEELERMNISLKGKIALIRYGKNFRGDKVNLAEKAGAVGVILYTDPADFSSTVNYPDSWFLPETGIQRGNILRQKGDMLSPGYPSIDGMYRMKVERVKYLHQIPVQPISFKDAKVLLSYLDGEAIPNAAWQGNIDVKYSVTARSKLRMRINVDVPLVDKPIYNVIGTIFGDVEPDRMILMGNHRDAWVYGAGDPSSGTATMLETSRVLGTLKSRGWKPRRTLVVCSWAAEEFGLMGSKEWVEEYAALLNYRAIAYINIDIAVQGNHTLRVKSSPHLIEPFYNVVKKLKVPGSNESLFEDWAAKTPNPSRDREPRVHKLGAGSDFTPFYSTIGVPAIDFRYNFNEREMKLASYPTYHTIYDNYNWMTKFVDPDFRYHEIVTKVWVMLVFNLLDSTIIPMNITRYSDELVVYINDFVLDYHEVLDKQGIDVGFLMKTVREFSIAASNFESRLSSLNHSNPLELRMYNDQLMELERCFIAPKGLNRRPNFKHVLYSPSSVNIYLGRAVPAVIEAIYRAQQGTDATWDEVQIQLSVVAYHITMAIKMLEEIGT